MILCLGLAADPTFVAGVQALRRAAVDFRSVDLPSPGLCSGTLRVPLLGVDFKLERATGAWFFLEANSMPCFEGYDERAGGAISRAIVDWLNG